MGTRGGPDLGVLHPLAQGTGGCRLVERGGGFGGEAHGVLGRRERLAPVHAGDAEQVAVRGMAVTAEGRLRESVGGFGCVKREVELDDLADALAGCRAVCLLRVEVKQEPAKAVASSTLGRDVGVHPFVGELRGREGLRSLDAVVIAESHLIGLLAASGDVGPFLLPGSSHRRRPPMSGSAGTESRELGAQRRERLR